MIIALYLNFQINFKIIEMKKLIYLVVAGFVFLFSACGASTEEAATETMTEEPAPAAAADAQEAADAAAEEAEAETEDASAEEGSSD